MKDDLYKAVRDYEKHMEGAIEEAKADIDKLFVLTAAYTTSYVRFFEQVKTDSSDSLMLLDIFTRTAKKLDEAIMPAGIVMMAAKYASQAHFDSENIEKVVVPDMDVKWEDEEDE